MAVIETMTFRLRPDADVDAFIESDRRLQAEFAYRQPGLMRRTTAQGVGDRAGEFVVIDLWGDAASADAAAERWNGDPVVDRFLAFVDRDTIEVRRYEDRPE